MMKPEKKIMKFYSIPPTGLEETFQEGEIEGWNDHYDAVEKWLPSVDEIREIIFKVLMNSESEKRIITLPAMASMEWTSRTIAEKISKRLRGEK